LFPAPFILFWSALVYLSNYISFFPPPFFSITLRQLSLSIFRNFPFFATAVRIHVLNKWLAHLAAGTGTDRPQNYTTNKNTELRRRSRKNPQQFDKDGAVTLWGSGNDLLLLIGIFLKMSQTCSKIVEIGSVSIFRGIAL
jgi:hypothetical protein